ncbi:MAG: response regulator [Verrucomicrobia bacterium]|nr:response regulator [Verrucomicrobiota bacterium]
MHRILVIDDNRAIHDDFRKILCPASAAVADLSMAEAALFGDQLPNEAALEYELDSAFQGQEALALVTKSMLENRPFSLAFVDVRMPPGWDGIETITRLWQVDPHLHCVICTAYSDYSWEEMVGKLGRNDRLLILKKPFDNVEVSQLVVALTEKWALARQVRTQMRNMEVLVSDRTAQLEKSAALTQATLDSTADGILVVNQQGRMAGYNKRFLAIWNLPPSLIESKHYQEMLNAVLWQIKDPEGFNKKFRELNATPEAASYDIIEFVDGRIFERYSHPQRMGEQIAGRVWSFRDITERKKAERQILQQASLIDLAQDAIIVRDLGHWITSWNKGAERLFGWTADEIKGRQVTELLYRDAALFDAAQRELLDKGSWSGEVRQLTKSGTEVIVSSRWTLVRDAEDHPSAVLAINTDLTEKKRLEAQFLRSQRMESIGTLAGGVAHDLNNILAPIMMSAPLLRQGLGPKETELLINNIETSAQRGADIVKQLLAFARGMEGESVVVNLRHLVDEMAKICRETFPKNITVAAKNSRDLWPIIGDPTHIHQVLLNLCINARDAQPNGGSITILSENITIDAHYATFDAEAKPGPYVVIRVSDTGSGIPPEILDKIFDPFFTTKEHGKGTGLGLSTVLGIAKSHGGFLNVSSEVGKGTTFSCFFPATPNAKIEPRSEKKPLPRGRGETVLVVDDEAGILHAARKLLETHGYTVLISGDGVEALAVFAQHKAAIKVILTDVMMPVMDGAAMMRVLKKLEPKIKVIATSGIDQDAKFDELRALGMKAFLSKPYNAEKILTTLRDVLDAEEPEAA